MSSFTQLWRDNPVLTKELRVRMRGTRAYWILTGYLLFLSFMLFAEYVIWWNTVQSQGGAASGSKIGQQFFLTIEVVQAFLVCFITPAVTSGAITIEKEQRTLDMLAMTRLSVGSIVIGKLLSAVSFVALLLISSLPLTSICFFLGGVSPEQVAESYLMLLAASFVAGALGLVWSATARTTAIAVIMTYASLLVPIIAAAICLGVAASVTDPAGTVYILCAVGLYGPVASLGFNPAVSSFFTAWDQRHYFALTIPQWFVPVATVALIGLTLTVAAAVRLDPRPDRRSHWLRLMVALVFAEQLFFLFGARFSVFSRNAPPGLAAAMQPYPLITMLFYPVLLLLLCAPMFTTGDIHPVEARSLLPFLLRGFTPAGWKEGRLNAGIAFLFALCAVVLGGYWLSFAVVGHPGAAATGNMRLVGASVPAPTPPGLPPGVNIASSGVNASGTLSINGQTYVLDPRTNTWVVQTPGGVKPASSAGAQQPQLLQVAASLIATVFGLSALGVLFTLATRNRWAAMALSYAVLLALFIVPLLSLASYDSATGSTPGFFVNLFYLDPLTAIADVASPGEVWQKLHLGVGDAPVWAVGVVGWMFISLIAPLFALPFVTRRAASRV